MAFGESPSASVPIPNRMLGWATAFLVAAQAAVVALQVVGRHLLRSPLPWTEEIARLLLVWLMCIGGIRALQESEHPRVTALVRLLAPHRRRAVVMLRSQC